jgi:hypothetical protein
MRAAAAVVMFSLAAVRAGYAQQGSVRITAAAHSVAADEERRAGQELIEPDLGVTISHPGIRFGTLFADLHAIRRDGRPHVGHAAVGVRDVKIRGALWSLSAGDTHLTPAVSDWTFTNLFAPQVTFAGASLSGFGRSASLTATAGKVTALRNIFGSDPETLGQDIAQLRSKYRITQKVELLARASRVRTRDVKEFGSYVDAGDDVGAGARVRVTPVLELSADGGLTWFRRRGSPKEERSPTALVGAHWAAPRGWVQLNAQRFAPGYFAVLNTPYLDREGAFAAAQFKVTERLRVYGGLETYRTNLDPDASAGAEAAFPDGLTQRGYGGARLRLTGNSFLSIRAEEGDRSARPVQRTGPSYDSDTGVVSADFQAGAKTLTAFVRYERRENVDNAAATASYTQHTSSAQLFARLGTSGHLFANAMLMQRSNGPGGGQTFWQGGGGFQWKLPKRQLWLRGEGAFSLDDDWETRLSRPHQVFSVGLSGQVTPRTAIAFDMALDRSPVRSPSVNPWLARSMLRLMHTIPTGTARVETFSPRGSPTLRRGGNGSLFGFAYADWNANGLADPGEETLGGIPVFFGAGPGSAADERTQVITGPDGEFAFRNVPAGRAMVSLDVAALPVDFDPPERVARETEVRSKGGERLAFGLIPLGSVTGSVLHDGGADGQPGPDDAPVNGAIVMLDPMQEGGRSEQTHGGAFRFDAVRPGLHEVRLVKESLPDGAAIAGEPTASVELIRGRMQAVVTFLVKVEKRKEIRRVFPPIEAAKRRTRSAPTRASVSTPPPSAATSAAPAPGDGPDVWFVLQVAALRDRTRARSLVRDLRTRGVDAYLSEDTDGLAKVRIGSYRSEAEARQELAQLQGRVGRIIVTAP